MKFGEALEEMKRGRPIRRACWPGNRWVQCLGRRVVRFPAPGGNRPVVMYFDGGDVLASDWELLNQPLSSSEGEPLGGIQQRTLEEVDRSAA
jgi:hypothetical protein